MAVFQTLRDDTVLAYKNAYGEWPKMDRMYIRFVEFEPVSQTTVIIYEEWVEDRWVTETWRGCTFQEVSEWWDESATLTILRCRRRSSSPALGPLTGSNCQGVGHIAVFMGANMAKSKYSPFDVPALTNDSLASLNALRISPDLSVPKRDVDACLAVLRTADPFALLGIHTKPGTKSKTEEKESVAKFPYDPSVGFGWDGDV